MGELIGRIKSLENAIEDALHKYEIAESYVDALAEYRRIKEELLAFSISESDTDSYKEQQRVLAYVLMREGNALRDLNEVEEANTIQELELVAAKNSGDDIAIARSLFSSAVKELTTRNVENGLKLLEEALGAFNKGDSVDHIMGAGWVYIIHSDLMNLDLIPSEYEEIVESCNHAIKILEPIENWQGLARAYEARAFAHKNADELDLAKKDEEMVKEYQSKD